MQKIESAILNTSKIICKNIERFDASDRGLLSQNILQQLRHFVEYTAQKIYQKGADTDPNDYENKKDALEYIKTQGELRFLWSFHSMLQKSVSHYTIDESGSERLMLKYYEYLLKVKIFLKDTYNLEVLENINEFPLNLDSNLAEYYEKIAVKINTVQSPPMRSSYNDRYYVHKIKPFFVSSKIYYEITFTIANDKASKFDRVIAFTELDISSYYAIRLSVRNDSINIMGRDLPIQIIDQWEVSIRACELNNFADIFGAHPKMGTSSIEYRKLMRFLTETQMNLVELVTASDNYYVWAKELITQTAKVSHFFDVLDTCRGLITGDAPGCCLLRYLLFKLNNRVIKLQRCRDICEKLSSLRVFYGCIPFDEMPFATSLIQHNPKVFDLLECINSEGREHELLARTIKTNTESRGILFTPENEILGFVNVTKLISEYNSKLYYKHRERRSLSKFKGHVYINEYAEDSAIIISRLKESSKLAVSGYTSSVESWLKKTNYLIDCTEKMKALKQMFEESRVALIYGSAGTGKSTLINHISHFMNEKNKVYLAHTNPAVDNLRRNINADNRNLMTVTKFLSSRNFHTDCDLLIIDECSTVSNKDMREILEHASFKLILLVGDVFQIESIRFGNWFDIARFFVSNASTSELTYTHRTTNDELKTIWDRVRNICEDILEPIVKNNCSVPLDDSIFDYSEDDEMILCLNYDGLYGINNINRLLQSNNKNTSVEWGINVCKIGDPILFNESDRFAPLIYNNMKGDITGIEVLGDRIKFEIELDVAINELDAEGFDFALIGVSGSGNSIISFTVSRHKSTDEDDESSDSVVPFQVAYAVSIHKAQGLEYESVKIVITTEVEELVTHNVFYTAITRAKKKLKIYWSPETENRILKSLKLRSNSKDANILASLYNLHS